MEGHYLVGLLGQGVSDRVVQVGSVFEDRAEDLGFGPPALFERERALDDDHCFVASGA